MLSRLKSAVAMAFGWEREMPAAPARSVFTPLPSSTIALRQLWDQPDTPITHAEFFSPVAWPLKGTTALHKKLIDQTHPSTTMTSKIAQDYASSEDDSASNYSDYFAYSEESDDDSPRASLRTS